MLKELYQQVTSDAASREAKHIAALDKVDPRKVFVWTASGLVPHDIQPPLRAHRAERLDDIKAAIAAWVVIDGGSLWISDSAVTLAIDDADRRETVSMPLKRTPEYSALCQWSGKWLLQDELVGVLRRDLRFLHARDVFLASIRKIRWAQSDAGQAVVEHGKESLGRNVEKSVAGMDDKFPEEATCHAVPYLGVASEPYPFVLTVDVNVVDRKFRLTVLPGQLDDAALIAREFIAKQFAGTENLTVLLGTM